MLKSTSILATVALSAMLAIGPTTASMARGGGGGGQGDGGGGHSMASGDHGFGGSYGAISSRGSEGMSGNHHVGGVRHGHYRGYRGGWNDVAYCEAKYRSYDPVTETYLGRDGVRHFCQ